MAASRPASINVVRGVSRYLAGVALGVMAQRGGWRRGVAAGGSFSGTAVCLTGISNGSLDQLCVCGVNWPCWRRRGNTVAKRNVVLSGGCHQWPNIVCLSNVVYVCVAQQWPSNNCAVMTNNLVATMSAFVHYLLA